MTSKKYIHRCTHFVVVFCVFCPRRVVVAASRLALEVHSKQARVHLSSFCLFVLEYCLTKMQPNCCYYIFLFFVCVFRFVSSLFFCPIYPLIYIYIHAVSLNESFSVCSFQPADSNSSSSSTVAMPLKRTPSQAKKSPPAVATGAASKRKKLSFDESTLKAASHAVQTTHVNTAMQQKKGGMSAPKAAAAAAKKRAVADMKSSGIVKAKRARKHAAIADGEEKEADEAVMAPVHSGDDDSSDDEADLINGTVAAGDDAGSDADDLSDLADRSSSDDEDSGTPKAARNGKARSTTPYRVVRLSFLPAEFQEPQLYKFLNQFGATVLNCFCVRSKRTHRSKGIAYVEFDKESVIPTVVDECNGMALGGMSVRARPVTMHRPMPSRKMVTRRRALAYAYRTKGAPLKKHDVSKKSPVALLIKAARTERNNNAHLKQLGVDFQTDFFQSQLKAIPAGLLVKKTSLKKAARRAQKRAEEAKAKAAVKTPAAAPKAVAKKAPRLAPKKVASLTKAAKVK